MIVRLLSGSFLFVLIFSHPTGPVATSLDGKTEISTGRPRNTSDQNQSSADTSTTLVSPLINKTGIVLESAGIRGTGEEEGRTDPNVGDDIISDNKRTHEDNDWTTQSSVINIDANDSDATAARSANNYTREVVDDTSTAAFLITSSLLRQQDLETRRHDESSTTPTTDQDLTIKHREQQQSGYSSVTIENASTASSEKNSTDWTTSSIVYTGSSTENIIENENTHPSRKTTGTTEVVSITSGPAAGKLVERTPHESDVVSKVTDAVVPDFKTETKVAETSGRAADDHVTQTDDVRNRKRDVNSPTPLDVTKLEFAYKSLWEDVEDTEAGDGKMESDGGGGGWSEGTSKSGIAGGSSAAAEGTGRRMDGKKDEKEEEDGKFTISAELRKARNRNEHFSLSFHGVPWREELNILVPVLCGMFGAMILVLAAYFLRNCPNNIRRLARMSRPSKLHRRKSDLNLLIDNSSGDEHP